MTFGAFTPDDARAYMQKVNVMDKAGAYAVQEYPELLGASWKGELENIIGLPLEKLKKELQNYHLLSL